MNVFYCTTSSDYFRLFNDIDLVSIFSSSKWGLFISGMIFSYKCTALWTNSPVLILCGHWESNDWYWHQQHQQTQHQHPLMCSILTVYCLYINFFTPSLEWNDFVCFIQIWNLFPRCMWLQMCNDTQFLFDAIIRFYSIFLRF